MSSYPSIHARSRVGVATLVVGICLVSACQNSSRRVAAHEENLAAAGFLVRPANTPQRQAMLARLPAHKFVRRTRGDLIHYVYADPSVCKCLYVGSQKAYDQYERDKQERQRDKVLVHELRANQHAAEDDDLYDQEYRDTEWNWGAWGPWGSGYELGAGAGW